MTFFNVRVFKPAAVCLFIVADTQLKKLVYLYLINYAKSNPDLTILAVNTFVKDAADPNPLIRALSVRTMGCIRVDRITEYLCEPLRRCLQDEVRFESHQRSHSITRPNRTCLLWCKQLC